MAVEISNGTTVPHATDYSDLLDKLVTFAVSTTDWSIEDDQRSATGKYAILKGIDYSGDKSIYVGIKKYSNSGSDIYGWILQGYTALNGGGFSGNPGAITGAVPAVPLWNDTIPYWFFVNPRRIIVVAKVNNIYMAAYLGLLLPYGSIGQWSYPLVIAGSNATLDVFANSIPRYSDNSGYMIAPFISGGDTSRCNFHVRLPTGIWQKILNNYASFVPAGTGSSIYTATGIAPYCNNIIDSGSNNQNRYRQVRPDLDGNYPLKRLEVLHGEAPDILGVLDGAFFTSGYNISAEDTITKDADAYIAFQDTFRNDLFSIYAIKSE
jgi:hypothetical protein